MSLPSGWINRQFARVERDSENWPEWMQRETKARAEALRQDARSETGAMKNATHTSERCRALSASEPVRE